jgi:uncharacterized protein with von Willebrand factor type A (vWA) domain
VPLHELPHIWWPQFLSQGLQRGKTDIILITDAIVRVPHDMEQSFLAWKKREQVRCITMVLGGRAGDLVKVSDEVFELSRLGLDQEAVQRCLSL